MGLRAGRHNFAYVTYDAASDVIYAKFDDAPSARREATPEERVQAPKRDRGRSADPVQCPGDNGRWQQGR